MDNLYLAHHGIKGQRWGIRRFQNEDGSLTPEGMQRYGVDAYGNMSKKGQAEYYRDMYRDAKSRGLRGQDLHNDVRSRYNSDDDYAQAVRNYRKWKGGRTTAIALGSAGAAALTAGAITGAVLGVKASKHKKSVNAVETAIQNLEMTNSSLENQRRQLQKSFQDIKEGKKENKRGQEFYEILPGQIQSKHSATVLEGAKNDLMTNTVLNLRDNVRAQKNNTAKLEDLKTQLATLKNKKNRFRTVENMKHSYIIVSDDYLMHHGIKGQKWGVRRFQNEDGTLTPEGRQRYGMDEYGNMTKKGAANYYKDLYNDAKASGYRGRSIHDAVRSKFNSEEEYQAFVKNYRNYKGKKAAVGIGAGLAGAALVGAGAYGISRGVKNAKANALADKYGSKYENVKDWRKLLQISEDSARGAKSFTVEGDRKFTRQARKEMQKNAIISETLAKRRMKEEDKAWKAYVKGSIDKPQEISSLQNIAERNIKRATTLPDDTRASRIYRKAVEKRARYAEKEAAKKISREHLANARLAAIDQHQINVGKDAIQNRMNAFSNSFFGKAVTGLGTVAGGVAVGAAATAGKKAVSRMFDDPTANSVFAPVKEYKDKSSALTMPTRADVAWRSASKEDEEKRRRKEDDD